MNTVGEFSDHIYNKLGFINPERISPYKEAVLNLNNLEVLAYNFRSYSKSYCEGFMLSVPELWTSMTKVDWYYLATKLSPRPEMGEFMRLINTAYYFDMIFLEKYLQIDNKFFITELSISKNDKDKMSLFREQYYLSFKREQEHLNDIQVFYHLDVNIFEESRLRLVSEGMIPIY